ncbi:hypothetical protein BpHYR1_001406 [Brachionus plicatilis]|uniref:Uncharacterized protein n=1 Tax=Brachionus plicatilis TaxID=10195 RepID=A0A3M7RWG7_BRAPC|nr:hypothetical protein BpHYR1_001406 [Brachionus plicatilis]
MLGIVVVILEWEWLNVFKFKVAISSSINKLDSDELIYLFVFTKNFHLLLNSINNLYSLNLKIRKQKNYSIRMEKNGITKFDFSNKILNTVKFCLLFELYKILWINSKLNVSFSIRSCSSTL